MWLAEYQPKKTLMCADSDFDQMMAYYRRTQLSRRQFGTLSIATALVAAAPPLVNAKELETSDVDISTADGICDAYLCIPSAANGQPCSYGRISWDFVRLLERWQSD